MRGKGASWKCLLDCKGITPAYAGKSLDLKWKAKKQQDHPRLCGEKQVHGVVLWLAVGSPPPMRGKVAHRAEHHTAKGITPAYAGKRQALLP